MLSVIYICTCEHLLLFFFLRIRRPQRAKRTDTLLPYTPLFRAESARAMFGPHAVAHQRERRRRQAGFARAEPQSAEEQVPEGVRQPAQDTHYRPEDGRSEEHTSELQSLMRISYAVFCLKKKNKITHKNTDTHTVKKKRH